MSRFRGGGRSREGRLIAVDVSDCALKHALDLGATHAVNPAGISNRDVKEKIH